jgi:hypothetical protein
MRLSWQSENYAHLLICETFQQFSFSKIDATGRRMLKEETKRKKNKEPVLEHSVVTVDYLISHQSRVVNTHLIS